jgi:hypothetical protein
MEDMVMDGFDFSPLFRSTIVSLVCLMRPPASTALLWATRPTTSRRLAMTPIG